MLKVGILGVSGYSGVEALELLLRHPDVVVTYVGANNTTGKISEIWPHLNKLTKLKCDSPYNIHKAAKCDCVFLALPHTISMEVTPELLKKGVKVIDLSGDYRLAKASTYKKWYGQAHKDQKNIKKAVYGLPELFREEIKKANLIANPGCYPTSVILGLAPVVTTLAKNIQNITVDAKSGASGAGRKASLPLNFCEVNGNFKAYRVLKHQHTPEIEQYISQIADKDFGITFVTHLLPIIRGILSTIYVQFSKPVTKTDIQKIYERFYKTEPFVRVLKSGEQPEIKNIAKTNFCDIGLELSTDKKTLVITSVIDNLVKGAAGQAVQNMNILFGFKEEEALL